MYISLDATPCSLQYLFQLVENIEGVFPEPEWIVKEPVVQSARNDALLSVNLQTQRYRVV